MTLASTQVATQHSPSIKNRLGALASNSCLVEGILAKTLVSYLVPAGEGKRASLEGALDCVLLDAHTVLLCTGGKCRLLLWGKKADMLDDEIEVNAQSTRAA